MRLSLYADDAAIFITPTAHDISNLADTLQSFGEATGLVTNIAKSSISSIRSEDIDLAAILEDFPAAITQFPIKYLGLPLSLDRLRRADIQPYIDKMASRLQPWQGRFFNRAGCTALVKSVLSSMPIFLLTAIKADKGMLKAFDKIRRGMLWNCSENVSGGKCKVGWDKVCRPKILGGLGILNLEKFSRALRLRWLWHDWASTDKPWVGSETPNDDSDRNLFNAATRVTVGDGLKASFWGSSWLDGLPAKVIAPDLFTASKRKNRKVQDALTDYKWISDLDVSNFTVNHISQFVQLWELIQETPLSPGTADSISWTLTTSGVYSAKSAYEAQFFGAAACSFVAVVWNAWAPPKCSFFAWLAVQNRLWTSDRLAIRGWPHQPVCQLCRIQPETARHLLFECRYSKRIWAEATSWLKCPSILQGLGVSKPTVFEYWKDLVASSSPSREGLKTATILITWEI